MNDLIILNNWEKAKNAIMLCKDIDEVKSIRDKAEALRAYAKQAGEGLVMQNNIADIKLRCEQKIGEFSNELPTQQGKYQQTIHDEQFDKLEVLKTAGINNYQRYEAIANLPEQEFENYIKEVKASNEELTTVGVLRLARKLNQVEKIEIPLPEGKYQVIYADPPWKYDVDLSAGATRSPENNYSVMDLAELIDFGRKVKEISAENCVLFMWTTAPKFDWLSGVLEAWGFGYKTNLIWDKVKPNLGHYSSVRHEILIIAGKGNCAPTCDGKTIQSIDSVQSIEKSSRHSEKPVEFRDIIDKLYPNYTPKIELFARGMAPEGWIFWGNQANE